MQNGRAGGFQGGLIMPAGIRKSVVLGGAGFLVAVVAVVVLWRAAIRRPETPPNVILIVIDALRPDHMGCYGYDRDTCLFMTGVANRGLVFENVTSPSTWTKTVMASVLTSRYPEFHGVRGIKDVLSPSLVLLPETLKSNGYETCCIHGNPWMAEKFGFNQGYDRFVYGDFAQENMNAVHANEYALEWLEARGDAPYFLYLHYMDVHAPYDWPSDCRVFGTGFVDRYDGGILWMDQQIRALLCSLEEQGLLDNTCVVITADHGEEFKEHGGYTHGSSLYGEVLRVPLIFYYPGFIRKGARIERHVSLMDLAPTIIDLAGIKIPGGMDGVSLMDDLRGSPFRHRKGRIAFSQVGLNDVAPDKDLIAVTTPQYKYILDRLSSREELYYLVNDPGESNDVSGSMPEIADRFRAMVHDFCRVQRSRRSGNAGKVELDARSVEKLKSLGYLK